MDYVTKFLLGKYLCNAASNTHYCKDNMRTDDFLSQKKVYLLLKIMMDKVDFAISFPREYFLIFRIFFNFQNLIWKGKCYIQVLSKYESLL